MWTVFVVRPSVCLSFVVCTDRAARQTSTCCVVVVFLKVEYSVNSGEDTATDVISVTVRRTVNDLISPVAFVREPTAYVNEHTHFVFMAGRHHPTMKYEIDYGDGGPAMTFNVTDGILTIPDWAGETAAHAFKREVPQCRGAVLKHVYKTVGNYTARVGVTTAQHSASERVNGLVLTAPVDVVVRRRTLAQMMWTARVFRRLPSYHNEYVVMLFRVYEYAESLSLSVSFGDDSEEMHTVRNMSGDSVPLWFRNGSSNDITVRASTATALAVDMSDHSNPFFGVVIERQFERPGIYDVRFSVAGTLPDAEAPQRALIVGRVDVREKRLKSQLAGGPLIYAHSPVLSGTATELLVIVRRLINGVSFSVDFGDGAPRQGVSTHVFSMSELPHWLLNGTFSSPEPFYLASRGVTYYGRLVTHVYGEPGFYAAVAKVFVDLGDHCEVFTSPATIIHVMDRSTPPMSQLLGDDALIVSTPLHAERHFQVFYVATRNISGARYSFIFGDGTGQTEGTACSQWLHIDHSDSTVAGRLTLDEARKGAATAVCTIHVYAKPGTYTVRVRLVATPSGVSQRSWNLGGRVTVLPRLPFVPTAPVSTKVS